MPDLRREHPSVPARDLARRYQGHHPHSADDIVVMISDVLYDYLAADGAIPPRETINHLLSIIDSPMGLEIYENEMARRQPRDVDGWH